MAKQWLMDRWEMLIDVLKDLTLEQEEEIARICQEEIAYWKSRPTMKSLSSLKKPMSDTRQAIKERLEVNDATAWTDPRTGERQHIALKYLNYTPEEWAEMNAQTEERFQQRLEDRKFIDRPDLVVAKAVELLKSSRWADIAAGLAATTGRRLSEVLAEGEFHPKTAYTIVFGGQLKRQDKILDPYEIPTLCEASLVLGSIQRLRSLVDCSKIALDQISIRLGPDVVEAAQRAFESLVPPREGADLYTHLFRAVYGRIACHYYAPPRISDLKYMSTIYGHYWVTGAEGKTQHSYLTTLHYSDYLIGDGAGNIDGRQGIKLSEPGVELLEVFVRAEKEGKTMEEADTLVIEEKKKHGLLRPDQDLMARIRGVRDTLGVPQYNDALPVMVDSFYEARQFKQFLERWEMSLEEVGEQVSQFRLFLSRWQTTIEELNGLLDEAAEDVAKENAKEKDEKKHKTPVAYLREMVASKRTFKQSYEKRHVGKDYATIPTSKLRDIKTTEAATERFRRAVDAIMVSNDATDDPDKRWYVNPAVVVDLVGGKPALASEYLETRRAEIDAHHAKFEPKLRPGFNRRPVPINQRITVPELPGNDEGTEGAGTEEATVGE